MTFREPDPIECHVRYVPGAGDGPGGMGVDELVARVESDSRRWGAHISAYLGREPSQPVIITLRGGSGFAMTKGNHIVVPVNANPGTLSALSHELVHAVVNTVSANGGRCASRLIDEGIAVHVDAHLRLGGDVWPFYHLAPHRWVALWDAGEGSGPETGTDLGPKTDADPDADPAADPGPETGPGRGPGRGRAVALAELIDAGREWAALWGTGSPAVRATAARRFYLHAGSYVGFVIERFGLDALWELVTADRSTPAGCDVATLQRDWMGALGGPPSDIDRQLRDRSLATIARRGAERVWARSSTATPSGWRQA